MNRPEAGLPAVADWILCWVLVHIELAYPHCGLCRNCCQGLSAILSEDLAGFDCPATSTASAIASYYSGGVDRLDCPPLNPAAAWTFQPSRRWCRCSPWCSSWSCIAHLILSSILVGWAEKNGHKNFSLRAVPRGPHSPMSLEGPAFAPAPLFIWGFGPLFRATPGR